MLVLAVIAAGCSGKVFGSSALVHYRRLMPNCTGFGLAGAAFSIEAWP